MAAPASQVESTAKRAAEVGAHIMGHSDSGGIKQLKAKYMHSNIQFTVSRMIHSNHGDMTMMDIPSQTWFLSS